MPGELWDRSEALERLGPKLHRYLYKTAIPEHLPVVVGSWFEGLGAEGLRRLSLAHLAARPETSEALDAARRLLWRLPSTVRSRQLVLHGEVRGAVDWQQTTAERIHAGDRTLFACRGVERRRDTALARLVRLVVKKCAEISDPVRGSKPIDLQTGIADKARDLASSREFRSRLGGTTGASRPGNRTLEAIASRGGDEHLLVAWLVLYEQAVVMQDPGMVEVLLRDQLLAPAANHDSILFELEVGFEIVEALERRGYQPMLGLLDGAVAFGRFTKSEQVVTVWSQKAAIAASGGIIGNSGPYARILAAAGLRRSALRPDFIIESNDPRRILLVEVKLHENGDEGAREGVRNMLAYLADAQTVLEALPRPHGLVISWGTSAKPNPAQRVLVAHQDAIDEAIGAWTDF